MPQKFRSHAMMLPAFATAAPAPTGSYFEPSATTRQDLRSPSSDLKPSIVFPSGMLHGRPHADEIAAVPGDSPGSLVP